MGGDGAVNALWQSELRNDGGHALLAMALTLAGVWLGGRDVEALLLATVAYPLLHEAADCLIYRHLPTRDEAHDIVTYSPVVSPYLLTHAHGVAGCILGAFIFGEAILYYRGRGLL